MDTTRTVSQKTITSDDRSIVVTRALLASGVLSGPLFYLLVLLQIPLRAGFDIRRHAISVLSLGDLGWIQITNFIVTGLLAILCAVGIRHVLRSGRAGTWGPLLIGAYGVGMVLGGIFHPDPGLGFPPGAPAGIPTVMSSHAALHSLAFFTAFLALIAASFVFLRRFAGQRQRGWAIYCAAVGLLSPVLIVLGVNSTSRVGVIFAIAGVVAFGWVSVISARLMAEIVER